MRKAIKYLLQEAEENDIKITVPEKELIELGILSKDGKMDSVKLYNHMESIFLKQMAIKNNLSVDDLSKVSNEDVKNEFVEEDLFENEKISGFDKHNKNSVFVNNKLYEKNTPFALRGRKQFIGWKWEWKENEKDTKKSKWVKIPMNPLNGRAGAATWKNTFSDFKTACEAVDKFGFDGVGIVFTDGLIGIDLDDVILPDGKIKEKAKEIIDTVASYTELSPSGTGIHILAFADIPESARVDVDGDSFEIYNKDRFFTLTGEFVPTVWHKIKKKSETNAGVNNVYNKFFKREEKQKERIIQDKLNFNTEEGSIGNQGLEDDEILKKCFDQFERKKEPGEKNKFEELYYKGEWEQYYPSQSDADMGLCGILTYYTDSFAQMDRLFQQSGLMRDKWFAGKKGNTYGENTLKYAMSRNFKRYSVTTKKPLGNQM